MTATLTASTAPPAAARTRSACSLWLTGTAAPVVASLATLGTAAAARALDVPLTVGGEAIPLAGFAQMTFVFSIIGTALAAVLARRANRPRRTFVVTTLALTVISFVPDVLADAHTATKFTLMLTHVFAAAI